MPPIAPASLRPAVLSFIETVLRGQGISRYEITDVQQNQKGEGYLSEIFIPSVRDLDGGLTLDFIVKAAFIDQRVRRNAPIEASFLNEIYFYTKVRPAYRALEGGSADFAPKCYDVHVEDSQEMLALADLKKDGFRVFDRKLTLDHEHVKLIFETYGRFHAYSFALKGQRPAEYLELAQGLENVYEGFFQHSTSLFGNHLEQIGKDVLAVLTPGEDDAVIEEFRKYAGGNIVKSFREVTTATDEFSCILHGDCWSNNMMFRYKDNKPADLRLIDFQIVKTGSPVCDLSYCLYSGASRDLYENLEHYLKIYHDSLSTHIRSFGSDPALLYPFEVLKDHWRKYARFGMIMAFGIIKMKLIVEEDIIDFTDATASDEDFAEMARNMRFDEPEFNRRVKDLLLHFSKIKAL